MELSDIPWPLKKQRNPNVTEFKKNECIYTEIINWNRHINKICT